MNKKIYYTGTLVVLILVGWFLFSFTHVNAPTIIEVGGKPESPKQEPEPVKKNIGTSVQGRNIESYTYGNGSTTLLFVGGVHGGYEWNSTLLAYEFINRLGNKIIVVPENLKVIVVPTLNPDGLFSVTKKEGEFTAKDITTTDSKILEGGRFNANEVDLNRNFDCKWKPTSTWRGKVVDAGLKAFSEPEAMALKNLVSEINPAAVIFWHSQANTVYGSECEEGILPETITLMNTYAKAAGYKTVAKFDAYPITGDAEGWLASLSIPAITVELETRTSSEWERNQKGIEAIFSLYVEK